MPFPGHNYINNTLENYSNWLNKILNGFKFKDGKYSKSIEINLLPFFRFSN